jgi:hypothetical protein
MASVLDDRHVASEDSSLLAVLALQAECAVRVDPPADAVGLALGQIRDTDASTQHAEELLEAGAQGVPALLGVDVEYILEGNEKTTGKVDPVHEATGMGGEAGR